MLLRMGLDVDGHERITTGANFVLLGGGEETHEEMVEKAIQIDGKLAYKGKQLEEVSADEFGEIARSVGLRRHRPPKPKQNNPLIQPLKSRPALQPTTRKIQKEKCNPSSLLAVKFYKKTQKLNFKKKRETGIRKTLIRSRLSKNFLGYSSSDLLVGRI